MSDNEQDFDKTPILLHYAKREELFKRGQDLFNEEKFFEAHEVWEELWKLEHGRDKTFLQGLIQAAGHFVHIQKGNWSGGRTLALIAKEKLHSPASNRVYRDLDVTPITSALDYNLGMFARHGLTGIQWGKSPPPVPDAFMIPKLFER